MSFLNPIETKLINESLAKALKRFESARDKLSTVVLSSGPAYAVRWAGDALEAEARYIALKEVVSFYDFDTSQFGNPELGREQADKRAAYRTVEKLRYICNGASNESEQVREAQAYAWAKAEFDDCMVWAVHEAKRAVADAAAAALDELTRTDTQ